MGTSPRTGLVTQPTQPDFFNRSQLVLYRLLFISYRFSSRDIGSVYLSRSTPRLISTFSQIRDVVSFYVHTAARATLLSRRRAAAKSTLLTRRGAAARATPLTRRGAAAKSTLLTAPVVAILSWTDRGHHVPVLTVASGGRGVGFDMHAWGRLDHRALEATSQPSSFFLFLLLLSFATPALRLGVVSGSCQRYPRLHSR